MNDIYSEQIILILGSQSLGFQCTRAKKISADTISEILVLNYQSKIMELQSLLFWATYNRLSARIVLCVCKKGREHDNSEASVFGNNYRGSVLNIK